MNTKTNASYRSNRDFFEGENQFLKDVLLGLTSKEKHLDSKYFYNAKGDSLFQKIMQSPEYYPTRCEMEILTNQSASIAEAIINRFDVFDVIELGAGDATKSTHLLKALLHQKINFTYYPIDISENVIKLLEKELPERLPGVKLKGLNGEYLQKLKDLRKQSARPKLVLFMGGNIGNVSINKAFEFCALLKQHIMPGDLVMIGFDLVKNPQLILDAYNDKQGYTRDFNLNLLQRINEELDGNFVLENFMHFPVYDPVTNACKSYLVSLKEQCVHINNREICFARYETIFMEIAQKYTTAQTDALATGTGFKPLAHFYDSKKWFLDALWISE